MASRCVPGQLWRRFSRTCTLNDGRCGLHVPVTSSEICLTPRAFDVEMLYIAQQLKIPIAEEAVNWQEIEGRLWMITNCASKCYANFYIHAGTKMVPVLSWMQMGRDLIFIRLKYMFGIWTIKQKSS